MIGSCFTLRGRKEEDTSRQSLAYTRPRRPSWSWSVTEGVDNTRPTDRNSHLTSSLVFSSTRLPACSAAACSLSSLRQVAFTIDHSRRS
ncbi:hypothetical protein J6590_016418 [Homalodisca vitripennis]|nr:hypothetical protein J6590_103010 [Homalodisca vitripennis]KAG8293459.1 hypothetical protein J6590_016418 [Homalodisca vitripennis]